MIINIRGTNGSGKSTLVQNIVARYEKHTSVIVDWKVKPIYDLHELAGHRALATLGAYTTATGGCDTLGSPPPKPDKSRYPGDSMDYIYGLVKQLDAVGWNVLFEGLLVCSDTRRLIELHTEKRKLMVLNLNTTVNDCYDSVEKRRAKAGKPPGGSKQALVDKHRTIFTGNRTIVKAGVDIRHVNRQEALDWALWELGHDMPDEWNEPPTVRPPGDEMWYNSVKWRDPIPMTGFVDE